MQVTVLLWILFPNLCYSGSQDNVVSTETRLQAGRSGIRILVGPRDIFLLQNVQISSGAQPDSYSIGTRESYHGVKRPGREANHSPPCSLEVNNAWSYNFTSPIHIHGVDRGNSFVLLYTP
jgi:hypothetical protein